MPDKIIKTASYVLSLLFFDLIRVRRRLVLKNLGRAINLPQKELKKIARKSYYNFLLNIFEFMSERDDHKFSNVEFEGLENLSLALEEKKGAFILCAHLGNWEVLAAAVNKKINPTNVIVKKIKNAGVNRFIEEKRIAIGMSCIERKNKLDAIRSVRNGLKTGAFIGFVLDQARPGEPKIPFFGVPASTNTSLASIWQRNSAPIIPTYIKRVGYNKHKIKFFKKIELTETNDREKDLLDHSLAFNQSLESMILENPEQYFWFHNRWK